MNDEQERLRREFGERLLQQAKAKAELKEYTLHLSPENAIDLGWGIDGIHYSLMYRQRETEVVLYFDTSNKVRNKQRFDQLAHERPSIDAAFGEGLDWRRQENTVVSRVRVLVTRRRGYLQQDDWSAIQEEMLDALIRLQAAVREPLRTFSLYS